MTMSLGPAAGSGDDGRVQQLEQHPVAEDKTLKPAKFGVVDDMDTTPKSEVPLAVNIMTPGATEAAIDQEHVAAAAAAAPRDYFTSRPSQIELQQQHLEALQSPAAPTPQSTTASASDITAVGTILDSIAAPANANAAAAHLDRPAPYTNASSMSVESTDSAVTVTAIPHAIRPVFPNQAYAALHDQQHQRYVPPLTRQRTSHPVRINNWTNAITSSGRIAMGSRTADNSPALTPAHGLFDVNAAPRREQYRSPDAGTYSSPYLHFTQQQAPKETHVADVDVDPLTGNKLINHYEIVDEIGRGAHGKVKLGRDLESEDTYVAIKIVERYSKRRKLGRLGEPEDKVKKEVAILKKARHPNVVALLEVIDDPSRKKVYIVLEWVSRGQIHWRSKAQSKEIAMIEARRYERERVAVNMSNEHTRAQEEAILAEAQKRLSRKKRQETKKWRQGLKNQPETQAFSHEMMGDNSGDDLSEDERLSRVSSVSATMTARHFPNEGRLPSRPPTPAQPIAEDVMTPAQERETREAFLELTEEPRPSSPATAPRQVNCYTGLEGTMYGAYDPSSGENTRAASRHSSEDLNALARDILDEDLNTELDYVPVMTLQQVRVAFRDTLLGLQYLHHQGIVHRDIKPPNLLSTNEHRVKISDFGVSYLGKAVNEDEGEGVSEDEALELGGARELAKTVGTPAFFAPELCITDFGDAEPLPVTKAIDVWALGITLFCMIFARTPFVDNEFVVMRQIAEEEVYIPRKRLVPVVLKPSSRPTSRSRSYNRGLPTGRREPYDLEYEGIDDDLYDLLKRLLIKDPRKRITLEEVRHHPWVVADFSDKLKWLEETDVTSWNEGKIEVSKEDVNAAVVPLFLDRVRSTVKKFGEKLGLSSTNRSRGQSNAGSVNGSPAPSVHSSSTAISQEARKQSLRGDETIFAALHKSREGVEHRLAMSASTSPENSFKATYFDEARSNAGSQVDDNPLRLTRSRPALPDRSRTVMSTSTTGSVRTIRQGDVRHITTESPPPSPGLPGTPLALESSGSHGLGAIMSSGTARRMLNTLRERSTGRSPAGSRAGSERGSSDSLKAHGDASVAVSNTSASGHVNLPETLREGVSENLYSDSERSLPPSALSSPHEELKGVDPASRQSSGQSVSSLTRWLTGSKSASRKASPRPSSRMAGPDTSPEQWQRAEEERNRRLIRERAQSSAKSQERHNFDDRTCPPSPDDQRPTRMSRQPSYANISNTPSSLETSPMSHGITPNPGLVSSSSEFGSAMSMSVSNPSIPSAMSETCSYDHKENTAVPSVAETRTDSSDGTINGAFDHEPGTQDDGYNPDSSAVNSEEEQYYDSGSDDSDTGITMGPAKHKVTSNTAQLTPQKGQHDPDLSGRPKKSSRSGSNNTMKKIRTRDSADERHARSPGISEAQDL